MNDARNIDPKPTAYCKLAKTSRDVEIAEQSQLRIKEPRPPYMKHSILTPRNPQLRRLPPTPACPPRAQSPAPKIRGGERSSRPTCVVCSTMRCVGQSTPHPCIHLCNHSRHGRANACRILRWRTLCSRHFRPTSRFRFWSLKSLGIWPLGDESRSGPKSVRDSLPDERPVSSQ